MKSIERRIGRTPGVRYGPRVVDLDLLFYGDCIYNGVCKDGDIILPHPRLQDRDFVLQPLCDICPGTKKLFRNSKITEYVGVVLEYIHPVLKLSMLELWNALTKKGCEHAAPVRVFPLSDTTLYTIGSRTLLMGILNVTPDSFSSTSDSIPTIDEIVVTVTEMQRCKVDILDIGGESTRPGATPVSAHDEIERVVPVITALRLHFPHLLLSIDTSKAAVASAAIEVSFGLTKKFFIQIERLGWSTYDQ